MLINKRAFLEQLSLTLLVCSYALFPLYEPFGLPPVINAVFWSAALILLIMNRKIRKVNLFIICMIIMMLEVTANIRINEYINNERYYLVAMAAAVLFVVLYNGRTDFSLRSYYPILVTSLLAASLIMVYKIFPDIYLNMLEPMLNKSHAIYNQRLISEGYAPSLSLSIGITADYLIIGVFLILSGVISDFHLVPRTFFLLFLMSSIIFLNRRGELVALLIAILFAIYVKYDIKKKTFYLMAVLLTIILSLGTIGLFRQEISNYAGPNRLIETFVDLLQQKDISNGRSSLYSVAINLFLAHPFFGIGWGSFSVYGANIITNVSNVHNIYLQLLCETGIFGMLVFVTCLVIILIYTLVYFRRIKENNKYSSSLWFSIMLQSYLLLKGIVDNPLYNSNYWMTYTLAILPILYVYNRRGIDKNLGFN